MKLLTFLLPLASLQPWTALGRVLPRQGDSRGPLPLNKTQSLTPHNFASSGAKRVKMYYGPLEVPGTVDALTHGMKTFANMNAAMPCRNCMITGYTVDVGFEDGTKANANKGMWLHHIGLMNLNRTDAGCPAYPERFTINGNERSPFDYTVGGKRTAGYYLKEGDEIFFSTDLMNMSQLPRTVFLIMEWEYIDGLPQGWDIVTPIWLDVKSPCLNEPTGFKAADLVFNTTNKRPWSPSLTGELYLMVSHVHDGNVVQEVYLDDKLVCESFPGYGEGEGFVTHVGEYGHELNGTDEHEHEHPDPPGHEHEHPDPPGHEHEHPDPPGHGHDHGTSDHILHISSITQCSDPMPISPSSSLKLISRYDMKEHEPMMDHEHEGELEDIMAIQFLHVARSQDVALKEINAMKPPGLEAFLNQVRGGGGG